MTDITVHRIDHGYFVRPAAETGTGESRAEPALGYLIVHPRGRVLVDSGMGADPEVDAWYQPRRIPLDQALRAAGASVGDITAVVNCHLHFDHCGGNPVLVGRPIFVQRSELALARSDSGHTLPELVDFHGARYEELDGETEILPGVRILPTPGHTAGHQSVVVTRADGTVVVAGQSHDTASEFSVDAMGHRVGTGTQPDWVSRILALDPREVVFAHDHAVWKP